MDFSVYCIGFGTCETWMGQKNQNYRKKVLNPFLEANVDEAREELVGRGGLPVVGYAQHLEDRLQKKTLLNFTVG